MNRRAAEKGFTLTELMTTVTIVGILASVAVVGVKEDREGDSARLVSNMSQEARRRAISGGPVRTAVANAGWGTARTSLVYSVTAGQSAVSLFVLAEDPEPAVTASWELVRTLNLPRETAIAGVADAAFTSQGGVFATIVAPVTKRWFPDGTSEASTVFIKPSGDRNGTNYRVATLPLAGTPMLFSGW